MDANELERVMGFEFKHKPLLIGGGAMEHYGLGRRETTPTSSYRRRTIRESQRRTPNTGRTSSGTSAS